MDSDLILVISETEHHELKPSLPLPGQRLEVCSQGKAEGFLRENQVDIILLDGGVSHRQDFHLLEELKRERPDIPVVYLAETGSEETAVEAFRRGARDYCRKPINPFALREVLAGIMAMRRTTHETRAPYIHGDEEVRGVLSRVSTRLPEKVLCAIAFMVDNLGREVDLEHIACQAGTSRFNLCHLFKKHTRYSPRTYLTLLRMERAKVQLTSTCHSVDEIASRVGYYDQSSFTKAFKRTCGISPREYRKMFR